MMYEDSMWNITCSEWLRQKLYDSDGIQFFFHFYDICEGSQKYSQVQVCNRRKKALRTPDSEELPTFFDTAYKQSVSGGVGVCPILFGALVVDVASLITGPGSPPLASNGLGWICRAGAWEDLSSLGPHGPDGLYSPPCLRRTNEDDRRWTSRH